MDILNQFDTTLLLFAFGTVLLWLWWPSRHRKRVRSSRNSNIEGKLMTGCAYWGVTIRGNRCDAVQPFLGKKFAFDRAPSLPLSGCDSRRCQCRYQGLVERRHAQQRSGMDRRQSVRLDAGHPDHRSGRDRRRSVIAWKDPGSHVGSLSARHE